MEPATFDGARSPPPSTSRLATILAVGVVVTMLVLAASLVVGLRHNAWEQQRSSAQMLVQAMAEDIERTIRRIDDRNRWVARLWADPTVAAVTDPGLRWLTLSPPEDSSGQVRSTAVLDRDGTVLFGTRTPVPAATRHDVEAVSVHGRNPGLDLHVSLPFRASSDGALVVTVSRPIRDAAGQTEAIVLTVLDLAYLRTLMERMLLGEFGTISLLRDDDRMIARGPWDDAQIGADLSRTPVALQARASEGKPFRATSTRDRVTRLYVTERVAGTPLTLLLGSADQDVLRQWQPAAMRIGGITVVLSAGLLAAFWLFRRQLQRSADAIGQTRQREAEFRLLAESGTDLVCRFDAKLLCLYASGAAGSVLGSEPKALRGRALASFLAPPDRERLEGALARLAQGGGSATFEAAPADPSRGPQALRVVLKSVAGDEGEATGLVAILRDVSDRKRVEAALRDLAATDALTGLGNRRRFDAVLASAVADAECEATVMSLLVFDIDHFKRVNDRFGHPAGDACLRALARTVQAGLRRQEECAFRIGGEEFALVLPRVSAVEAHAIGERLRVAVEAMRVPELDEEDRPGGVTISLGLVTRWIAAGDASAGELLLAEADLALYAAKRSGRNRLIDADSVALVAPAGAGSTRGGSVAA